MTIGLMLLSSDGFYIDNLGKLPKRPSWDKEFITKLIKGKRVLCSKATLDTLPKSILDAAYFTTNPDVEYDINFGIDTFKIKPDLLIVTRSNHELGQGKLFRLSDYNLVLNRNGLEIYS